MKDIPSVIKKDQIEMLVILKINFLVYVNKFSNLFYKIPDMS